MLIQKNTPVKKYGIDCCDLQMPGGAVGGMECILEPRQHSVFHRHHESEIFVIVSGKGELAVDGKVEGQVGSGDIIYLQPFTGHALRNLSDTEQLLFTALYWTTQDIKMHSEPLPKRVLIISTPPTPNGDLHLGHLSGPYIGADIYRRYLQKRGVEAIHITGRDDNQTYVKRIAVAEKRTPEIVADDYAMRIRATWTKADIPLNFFSGPKETLAYQKELSLIISHLFKRGVIVEKTVDELYDISTNFSLHEGYIKGTCPHCGAGSDGNACEQCGRPNDCIDLINPVSTLPGIEVGRRQIRKLYFRMSAVADDLAELVVRSNMSTRARTLSVGMLAEGLPDICISHRSDWGIPVGIAGFEDQVIYVWFEMAAGYLAADKQINPDCPFFADPSSSIVHFYGFDNTYYHTLLFPAIYLALGGKRNIPLNHVINELLYLRGEKFSTSRRHLIWGQKLLTHVSSDYVRWGLSRARPELKNENFDLDQFIANTNMFFADRLQGWIKRSLTHLAECHHSVVPEPGSWTQQHTAFRREICHLAEGAEQGFRVDSFSPQTVTRRLEEMVLVADEFFATQCRYENSTVMIDNHRTSVALNFWAMGLFARLAIPIAPESAQRILVLLGLEDQVPIDGVGDFIRHGRALSLVNMPTFAAVSPNIREAVLCVD